jgi:hypothetical protein
MNQLITQPDLITMHKDPSNTIITAYKKDTKWPIIKTIYMNIIFYGQFAYILINLY